MPIYDDLDDQGSDVEFVERCRRDFVATGNPLYAWEAWATIAFTRRSTLNESLETPDWLSDYFDACAHRLIGVAADAPAEIGEGPGSVGRAVGFSSGLAKAREQWGGPYRKSERITEGMIEMMWERGLTASGAADKLSADVSRATLYRRLDAAPGWLMRRMQDRVESETGECPGVGEVVTAYSRACGLRGERLTPA